MKSVPSLNRQQIQHLLSAGAARNALDCALWDVEAKASGKRVWELANIPIVRAVETAFTISLNTPAAMATAAKANANAPILKLKLDKTGGLTEALLLSERARESGFKLLIGCMVCTSLGIAPARLLASAADYVDLDGPLLLAGDRHHRLSYQAGKIALPSRDLWG